MSCGCGKSSYVPYSPKVDPAYPCNDLNQGCTDPCDEDCFETGCKVVVDTDCVHYNGNSFELEGLDVTSGSTLTEILKAISDQLVGANPLDLQGVALGYLATKYNIRSFKDFAEAVVGELTALQQKAPSTRIIPTYKFKLLNTGNAMGFYNVRDANGILKNNQQIAGNSAILLHGVQGVEPISTSVIVMNLGNL
jgi:hypothetical protein